MYASRETPRLNRPSRPSDASDASSTPKRPSPIVTTNSRHLALAGGDLWLARCLALADNHAAPLPACAARWVTPHEYDEPLRSVELFALPSRSRPGRTHLVRYSPALGALRCLSLDEALDVLASVAHEGGGSVELDLAGCIAGQFGRPCRHAGAAWAWIAAHDRWIARTPAERARDERLAWEDEAYWDGVYRLETGASQ